MTNKQILLFVIAILSGCPALLAALTGTVSDAASGEPIVAAAVRLSNKDWALTDIDGHFSFPDLKPGKYGYEVEYIGYKNAKGSVEVPASGNVELNVRMDESSLALNEVTVTAEESKMGSRSRVGLSAISHLQAKSVEDILQLLPGAVSKNPDLTNAGQASIREISSSGDANNALGTAVIVDGAPLSNDANMQVFSSSRSGSNSSLNANGMNDQTTSGRGVDLRQISPDNIESIEVIRGIPSVEYGNLTSGAIVVRTKAGVTPWEVTAKVDPNSHLFSAGKGLKLPANYGTMNFAVDYTKSVADRRKSYLGYDRITGNVSWSRTFLASTRPLTFNLRASYYRNLSDTKSDDSFSGGEYYRNEEQGFRVAVNGAWRINSGAISSLRYSASAQYAHQQDISNRSVGSGTVPYSHSYIPGEMVVDFLPTSYMSHYTLDGKPLNVFASLNANRMVVLPSSRGSLNVKLGVDYTLNVNNGSGLIYDVNTPPTQGEGQSVRPRSYSDIPAMNTLAGYLEAELDLNAGSTVLTLQPGVRLSHLFINREKALRGDITTTDPRINASWQFLTPDNNSVFSDLSITGGYGIASKMPTMAYLYPNAAYYDFVNYNSYLGIDNPANIAVMTTAVIANTANKDLREARSHKWEVGLTGRIGRMSGSVTYFRENATNEFGFVSVPFTVNYNRYVIPSAGATPVYHDGALHYITPDGTEHRAPVSRMTDIRTYATPSNSVETHKHGIEYSFNFGRIKPLSTDLIVDGAWMWIKRRSNEVTFSSSRVVTGTDANGVTQYNSYLGVMPAGSGTIRTRANTNLRLVTHIPAVRLVFSTTVQLIWHESQQYIWQNADGENMYHLTTNAQGKPVVEVTPIGYYDHNMKYHVWNPANLERPDDMVSRYATATYFDRQTYPFTCQLNFKLTKEIGRWLSLSFVANNFLKFSRMYRQDVIGGYRELYSPLYFGTELKIKI